MVKISFTIKEKPIEQLARFYGCFIVGILIALFFISKAIHNIGPEYITQSENKDVFVGESARNYLKPLTDLGPRVVGSQVNEEVAVSYLRKVILDIINGKDSIQDIKLMIQKGSGNYYLDFSPHGSYNVYDELQNVIVKISAENENATSILVNSHYDTVPESPGGSDDGIMVAVMLEIIRILSKSNEKPKNHLVFLFNGGEEVGLLASHLFIHYHDWAQSCKVVVNLEATGAGGKEILFQTGPGNSWLLDYYADTPHPHAQVAGEELFQSGLIPSDTDFRIFRDFGQVIGFDFAFYEDGYRYHTPYDGYENIENKWIQHTGDNVLHLVRKLSADKDLKDKVALEITPSKNIVFYDYIGLFFVHYGKAAELIINLVTAMLSLASAGWCLFKIPLDWRAKLTYTSTSLGWMLLGWILAAIINVAVGYILDAASRTMTWYASPALIIPLYCLPAVSLTFAPVTGIQYSIERINNNGKYEGFSMSMQAEYLCHLYRLIWTIVLVACTAADLRSVYVIVPYILFTAVGFILVQCLRLWKKSLENIWIPIYIIALVMPTLFTAYLSNVTMSLLVPIMGRFGDAINPELIVGGLVTFLTIVYVCTCAPFIIFNKNQKYFYILMGALYVIFLIVIATPAAFPYSEDALHPRPQRYWIFHSQRIIRDSNNEIIKEDSGFTFNAYDRNSPDIIEDYVSELKDRVSLASDCHVALFCGLPTTNSRNLKNIEDTIWIPTPDKPVFLTPTKLELIDIIVIDKNTFEYHFVLKGPDRMNIYISPRSGIEIESISLVDRLVGTIEWNDREVYNFLYASGNLINTLTFEVTVIDYTELDKTIDVAITGKYVHDDLNKKTLLYQKFLNGFPPWTTQTPWLGYYENFVF